MPFLMDIHAAVSSRQHFAGPSKGVGPNGSSSSQRTTAFWFFEVERYYLLAYIVNLSV